MAVAKKTRKGKASKNRTKEGPRTGVRTSGRTNSIPGQPSLHRAGLGEEKTYKKRSQRASGLALPRTCSFSLSLLFASFAWTCPQASAKSKSLQSCPTLCYPIDDSPPGSPVPRILQARTLEWVAISFSKNKALNNIKSYSKSLYHFALLQLF